jgi:Domain of unknown function (DUF3846)
MKVSIRVIIYAPGQHARVEEVEDTLQNWQKIVEGYIEMIRLPKGLTLICNEEGKLKNLQPNRRVGGHHIVGTFFLVRVDSDGNFDSVTDEDIGEWSKQ